MKTYDKFKELIWMVNTISRSNGITFADINKKWVETEMSYGVPMYRSTFNRLRDDIANIFGIIIGCNLQSYKYFIENKEVLSQDTIQNWMISTLSVGNIVSDSMSIQDRVFLETIPDSSHLTALTDAMKKGVKVIISYQKYGSTECNERIIEPYILKLFRRRWYVMSNTDNGYRTFSFDRIVNVKLTKEKFVMDPSFIANDYFADCYGVMRDDRRPPVSIILRAFGSERYYMEDLPIHPSQREISKGENHTDYEITMRPTSDFVGYLMSRGQLLKVLQPQSLAEEVKALLTKTLETYNS